MAAFGFPFPAKCEKCGAYCSASASVQGNLLGLMLLGFLLSVALSIKHRSFISYGIFGAVAVFSLLVSCFFVEPQKAAKPSARGALYLLLAAFLVLVVPHILARL